MRFDIKGKVALVTGGKPRHRQGNCDKFAGSQSGKDLCRRAKP